MSVRPLTEAVDETQATVTSSWAHDRYQRFTIWPIGIDVQIKLQRASVDADWMAQARHLPAVPDRARLVALDRDGQPELVFHVKKVTQVGRKQLIYMKETGEIQS